MSDRAWDPKGLEAAKRAVPEIIGEHHVINVLAAYLGSLEPVGWQVETKNGKWLWAYDAKRSRDEPYRTGRIRPLYAGPAEEPSDER